MRTLSMLVLAFVSLGLTFKEAPVPLASCVLCIGHHGTCGCDLGHVVCCDGEDAYACPCR